jgi:hypothetical protein
MFTKKELKEKFPYESIESIEKLLKTLEPFKSLTGAFKSLGILSEYKTIEELSKDILALGTSHPIYEGDEHYDDDEDEPEKVLEHKKSLLNPEIFRRALIRFQEKQRSTQQYYIFRTRLEKFLREKQNGFVGYLCYKCGHHQYVHKPAHESLCCHDCFNDIPKEDIFSMLELNETIVNEHVQDSVRTSYSLHGSHEKVIARDIKRLSLHYERDGSPERKVFYIGVAFQQHGHTFLPFSVFVLQEDTMHISFVISLDVCYETSNADLHSKIDDFFDEYLLGSTVLL